MARFLRDMPKRTVEFATTVMALFDKLPNTPKARAIGQQLVRSGTSIGAKVHVADGGVSRAEFTSFCTVAQCEAAESVYWLELCRDQRLLTESVVGPVIREARELRDILASIVHRLNRRSRA